METQRAITQIQLGDLVLTDPSKDILELANLLLTLLKEKEVKEYLHLLEKRKLASTYTG